MSRLLRYAVGSMMLFHALAGCTVSRMVAPTDESALRTIRRTATTKVVRIGLVGGTEEQGRALHITPDSTSWIDAEIGGRAVVPTDSVVSISLTVGHPGRGALIGATTGAVAGGAWYLAASGGEDFGFPYTLLLVQVPGTIAGTVFGTIIGGRRVHYWLRPRPGASR